MWFDGRVLTLGIDLASQARDTGVCAVRWEGGTAAIVLLAVGAARDAAFDDAWLTGAAVGGRGLPAADKVGVDAPFGWPAPFVAAVGAREPADWPLPLGADRAGLVRRETDRRVWLRTGKLPLSVSTDRIAYPAMRCAGLLAWWGRHLGEPVGRAGDGLACETYPDAVLRTLLGMPKGRAPSYKGPAEAARARRRELLDALALQGLALGADHRAACEERDDALDALLCAIAARAAALGLTERPGESERDLADREGWIHLPTQGITLKDLLTTGSAQERKIADA